MVAQDVIAAVIAMAASLATMSERFAARPDLGDGVRLTHTKGYNIYYRNNNERAEILRIVYGRRNIAKGMFE